MAGGAGDELGTPRSNEDLIVAMRDGEREAADELARRHYPRILAALARQLRDPEEARDLAQDTFYDAFRALGTLRMPAAFPAWLRRIAQNRVRLLVRRRAAAPPEVPLEDVPELVSPAPTPEQRRVRRTLAVLSPEDRTILVMDGVCDMAGAEIAAALGVTRAAAYARLARARGRFVARYAEETDDEWGEGDGDSGRGSQE